MGEGSGRAHALITGGSSGIGLALALRLAGRGAAVTVLGRDAGKLAQACARIVRAHPAAVVRGAAADVREAAAVARAAQEAGAALGPVETLIACAGEARPGRFEDLPQAAFRDLMEVNYFGVLNTLQAVLPGMRARGRGRVCVISSGAGLIGLYGYTAYAPTKFAVRGLAEALRAECAPDGVRVCVAYPPDTDTPQLAAEAALKPAQTKAIAGRARVISADAAAAAILRGMDAGRADIYIGREMAALGRFHSLAKPVLDRWFDRLARKAGEDG